MKYATFSIPPKIVHGVGALEFLSTLEGKKAAIVTGGSSMKKFGFGEDVANAVAFFARRESSYITGESLLVDGGMGM